jgi:ABC-type transporter Mla subunit MlaD
MSEMRRNVVVGLFVLCGLIALGTLIVMFGQRPTWFAGGGRFLLNIHFDTVTGIKPGTAVTIGGIPVGRVEQIGFRDPEQFSLGANVVVTIDSRYSKIPQGTRAVTTEPGLGMGRPPIELATPVEVVEYLPNGAVIPGEMVPAMDALFPASVRANFERTAVQIGETAQAMTPVLEDLHEILKPLETAAVDRPGGPQGNMSTVVARIDAATRHFNEVLGDPNVKSNLREMVDNVTVASRDIRDAATDVRDASAKADELVTRGNEFMADAQHSLTNLDNQISRVGNSWVDMAQTGGRVLQEGYVAMQRVNAGEGTAGRFLNDERLYDAAVLMFQRMAELMQESTLLVKEWQRGRIRVAF